MWIQQNVVLLHSIELFKMEDKQLFHVHSCQEFLFGEEVLFTNIDVLNFNLKNQATNLISERSNTILKIKLKYYPEKLTNR